MGRRLRQQRTLIGHMVRQVGYENTGLVLGLMVAWAAWVRVHGTAPTIDQLAGHSDKSRSQWFRYQANFRKCFPKEKSPDRMVRLALDQFAAYDPDVLASMPLAWFG